MRRRSSIYERWWVPSGGSFDRMFEVRIGLTEMTIRNSRQQACLLGRNRPSQLVPISMAENVDTISHYKDQLVEINNLNWTYFYDRRCLAKAFSGGAHSLTPSPLYPAFWTPQEPLGILTKEEICQHYHPRWAEPSLA